ncbi:MAG: hypothetical protein J0M29_13825 [Chitinophagales bacterium]|nr:hypothetical protein [Chitinophagales bacterium]
MPQCLSVSKVAIILVWAIFWMPSKAFTQVDPAPFECAMCCDSPENSSSSGICANSSTLWSSNERHIPRTDARTIYVHANFIIPRRSDDLDPDTQGNFSENNAEHMAFLNAIVSDCNWRLANLTGTSNCGDLRTDAKIQIIPNFIFLKDEFAWNSDNSPNSLDPDLNFKCPSQIQAAWHLANLSNQINSNPNMPRGINVFFPVQGDIYHRLIILGVIDTPEGQPYYCKWWCSEKPSSNNLNRTSNISITNLYMKYRWFQKRSDVTGFPFEPTGREILIGEALRSLAHEFGHSFINEYTHLQGICDNHLMTQSGGARDVLRATDVGSIHRNLATSNLRQFVDCTETYNHPGSNTSDRIVDVSETWDLNMRLYTNVVVKAGATLTVTCELLMPFDGSITVERGARLIIDGGNVRRANTCSPSQFWRGIAVQGNNLLAQPDPDGILNANQAGVVLLRGNSMIEGAVIGAAAKGHPLWDVPQFRGGLIQANGFTFRDCRKGAEFMKYDPVNFSKFENVLFERTASGSMHTGVSIWDTDGILFEGCTFNNVATDGIVSWDAAFNVTKKNRFIGAERGILAGGSNALLGSVKVGILGLELNDRNKFENNVVGIRATANSNLEIFSNDFVNFDFDVAINGTTQSFLTDNFFASGSAGNQFENTGDKANHTLCNTYSGNIVGTNIVGKNQGFLFREEDFSTDFHDLFIEPFASFPPSPPSLSIPGEIQLSQGSNGFARWNYFTPGKPENIKTSTILPPPLLNTIQFFYFHPNPNLNARVKPKCSLSDVCMPQSNFTNVLTGGEIYSDCMFPESPQEQPCTTKACLDALRIEITQKNSEYAANPTPQLAGEIQVLVSQRERITSELIRQYIAGTNWTAVETLLNEDLNPANRRRLVAAKLEQNQFAAANGLLQAFPQSTMDDQYFVQVQGINAARLSNPEFTLNAAQEETLLGIANSSSQEAGYAQSILGILTGRTFMPRLPNLTGERSDTPLAAQSSKMGVLQVAPNPANETILVQLPKQVHLGAERVLELRDIATGILVQQVQAPDDSNVSLSVQTTPSGIYVLSLLEKGVVVARQKITIQH